MSVKTKKKEQEKLVGEICEAMFDRAKHGGSFVAVSQVGVREMNGVGDSILRAPNGRELHAVICVPPDLLPEVNAFLKQLGKQL